MKDTDDPTDAEYQALAELRYQIRRFLSFSEQAARACGLEPQQHQLLLAIKGLPADKEPRISVLARRLQVQHNSTVELIDRLERRGLVVRERNEADRRQVFVRLTREGEGVLSHLARIHRQELRSAGSDLLRAVQALVGDSSARALEPAPIERAVPESTALAVTPAPKLDPAELTAPSATEGDDVRPP